MNFYVVALLLASVANGQHVVSFNRRDGSLTGNQTAVATTYQKEMSDLTKYMGHNFLYALSACVVAIFIFRIVLYVNQYIRTIACITNNTQRYFAIPNTNWSWFKNKILYAPVLRVRHNREIRLSSAVNMGTLPTRFQALFLLSIVVTNVTVCVYGIPWSDPSFKVLPFLRNRTGTVSVANLIPIMLMSGPANPLIKLLNVSFDSFNMMHRWFARMSILQALAHTLCWMLAKKQTSGWEGVVAALGHSHLIMTGLIGTVLFLVLGLHSLSPIRHAFYEFFVHFHIALVIASMVFLWMHLDGFKQQNVLGLALAVWAAMRLLRAWSWIKCNIGRGGTKVVCEALPGDAVRVSFIAARPWKFEPGQYLYATIPSVGLMTAHPFSVAWSDLEDPLSETCDLNRSNSSASSATVSNFEKRGLRSREHGHELDHRGRQTLSCIIRRRTGFTDKLYRRCFNEIAPSQKTVLSAYVEGPYGLNRPLISYGTVMLFAGGVGITHQIPYVRQLVQGFSDHTVAARRVSLIWIIQSPEHLEWIRPWMTQILGMSKRRDVLRIKLFVTRPRNKKEVVSPSATVQMFPGRPDINHLIGEECENQIGTMGVSVCGTGELQDEVRRIVRDKGQWSNIDFVEESFTW